MLRTPKGRKLHRRLSDGVIADSLANILFPKARKVVARAADACERTVKEWCLGRRLPNAAALIRLMAADDDVFHAVLELAGRSSDLSPEQKDALAEILNTLGVR